MRAEGGQLKLLLVILVLFCLGFPHIAENRCFFVARTVRFGCRQREPECAVPISSVIAGTTRRPTHPSFSNKRKGTQCGEGKEVLLTWFMSILRLTLRPGKANATSYPCQSRSVDVVCNTLPARRSAPSPSSRDSHTVLDWLRWLAASATLGRKVKRSIELCISRDHFL